MSDALSAPAGETSLGGTDQGGILRPILALLLLASGHPSRLTPALRAVARACATNPVALVIPCHRVVRGTGELGGYRWGLQRKRVLLDTERAAARK